jgi:tRNA dimethylallyltransferase
MVSEISAPKVVIICGPTGVGKTAVAIELAEAFEGEIISADSMQIYKHMNIGTAKPGPHEQGRVPHHMIDIIDPNEPFDARRFAKMAQGIIIKLHERHIVPFVVGGTGLYIKALVYGLFQAKSPDPGIRIRLRQEAKIHGTAFLHERLSRCDPAAAERIHPNDTYRLIRALQVYEEAGKTISEFHHEHRFRHQAFRVLKIGLEMSRETLYDRINCRVDAMIEEGLVDEVKALLRAGYTADLKSMQAIGYRHVADFIQGRLSWNEMLRTLKRDTRRYAKRQLTWFRADQDILWVKPEDFIEMRRWINHFLKE